MRSEKITDRALFVLNPSYTNFPYFYMNSQQQTPCSPAAFALTQVRSSLEVHMSPFYASSCQKRPHVWTPAVPFICCGGGAMWGCLFGVWVGLWNSVPSQTESRRKTFLLSDYSQNNCRRFYQFFKEDFIVSVVFNQQMGTLLFSFSLL